MRIVYLVAAMLVAEIVFGSLMPAAVADPKKSPYSILGVTESASLEDIKAAFRRLAKLHHPDKGGDPAEFAKINQAYEDLKQRVAQKKFEPAAVERWLRIFSIRKLDALKGPDGDFYRLHPLTLFYRAVVRAPEDHWWHTSESIGLKGYYFDQHHERAIQIELQQLRATNYWPLLEMLQTVSRAEAIEVILSTRPSPENLDFVRELILSADPVLGAEADQQKIAEVALGLNNDGYFRDESVEGALREPFRNYLFTTFPDRNHLIQLDGWSDAKKFMRQSTDFRRKVSRCVAALTEKLNF